MSKKTMGKLPTVNFDEYSDEEKERIYQECEKIGPDDAKPLRDVDRKLHALTARRAGRPKVGQGVNRIR